MITYHKEKHKVTTLQRPKTMNNVGFVEKHLNPPNCPELRLIEIN